MNGLGLPFRPRSAKAASQAIVPEIEMYIHLLVIIYLIDNKKYTEVCWFKSWCQSLIFLNNML